MDTNILKAENLNQASHQDHTAQSILMLTVLNSQLSISQRIHVCSLQTQQMNTYVYVVCCTSIVRVQDTKSLSPAEVDLRLGDAIENKKEVS